MSIKVSFVTMCELAIVNQHGLLSLINLIGNIEVVTIPGGIEKICVAIGINGEGGDPFTVDIEGPPRDPKKKLRVIESRIDENLYKDKEDGKIGYIFTYVDIKALMFTAAGIHHIVVRSGKKIVFRQPFGVLLRKPVQETEDAGHVSKHSGQPEAKSNDVTK